MELVRSLTSTVYVVDNNKVLLHMHKKFQSLFPLGGHIMSNELPHEAAIREAFEESGLKIELHNEDISLELGRVKQLNRPAHMLLENIGHEVENIDFIYFATTVNNEVKPQNGESKELYWFSKQEIINNQNIKPHIRAMALDALDTIRNG